VLSYQVLQEFYNTVTRKIGVDPVQAQLNIRELLDWGPVPVSREVLEEAWVLEGRYGLSWWDALIVSAAHVAGCAVLLTEDLAEGQVYGTIKVVNPFKTAPGDAP
jgi:predicted nucleic acid-binding protein